MIYLDDFCFPSLPETISVKTGANYQNYNLLTGKIAIPSGTDMKSVKWSATFFGRKRRRTVLMQEWVSPEDCIEFIEDAIASGDTLNLIVDEAPINLDVTIASFSYEPFGAFGDINYTIELQDSNSVRVYTTTELNMQPIAQMVETRPEESRAAVVVHEVKEGDTLWRIARKYYGGAGTEWQKIYNANAAVIESTAKKYGKSSSDNGKWIYPGCILTIP